MTNKFISFKKIELESEQTIQNWLASYYYPNIGSWPAYTRFTFYNKATGDIVGEYINDKPVVTGLTNPVTGTGTANQLAYFTGASTIGSLNTTTYPTLTELSRVKGVTSAIQTQLNNKLGKTETAADSSKLGNQSPSYYLNTSSDVQTKAGRLMLLSGAVTGLSVNKLTADGTTIYEGKDIGMLSHASGITGLYVNSAQMNRLFNAHKNPDWIISSSHIGYISSPRVSTDPNGRWYAGESNTANDSIALGSLFDNSFTTAAHFPVDISSESPLDILIETANGSNIDYSDTATLVLMGWRYDGGISTGVPYLGYLNSYKVEIYRLNPNTSNYEWITVLDRAGVNDKITAIYIPLYSKAFEITENPNSYVAFSKVRLTIRQVTKGGHATAWGFTEIRILDSRPAGFPNDAVGALSQSGGPIYGDLTLRSKFKQHILTNKAGVDDVGTATKPFRMVYSGRFTSTAPQGTAPLIVSSTTQVDNFNADLLDGQHGSYYQPASTAITTTNISSQTVDKANKLTTARLFTVTDNDGTNSQNASSSFDGSSPYTIKLPSTIKATLSGNATTATTLQTARTLTIGSTGKTFNGGANVEWTLAEIGAAATSHTHDDRYFTENEVTSLLAAKTNLKANTDNRNVDTIPNDYNGKFDIKGLKTNTVIGITDGGYYSGVLGIRGWADNSGGPAHELAFDSNGNINYRFGATTTWGAWTRLQTTANLVTTLEPSTISDTKYPSSKLLNDIISGLIVGQVTEIDGGNI